MIWAVRFLFFFPLFVLTACSTSTQPINIDVQQLPSPYSLQVLDELYDGETLFVQLELKKKDLQRQDLSLISLTGFDGNGKSERAIFNLVDFPIADNQEVIISLNQAELQDYQVELLWGDNATTFYQQYYPDLRSKLVILAGKIDKLQNCQSGQCQIKFRISCIIKNTSNLTVPALGLNLLLHDRIADNIDGNENNNTVLYQQHIAESQIHLAPGEERQLEYLLVQPNEFSQFDTRANLEISDHL